MKKALIICSLALLSAITSFAQVAPPDTADVRRVLDGDTYRLKPKEGKAFNVRPHYFDTAETKNYFITKDQPFGPEVKAHMTELLKGKTVTYKLYGRSFKRRQAIIWIDGLRLDSIALANGWGVYVPLPVKSPVLPADKLKGGEAISRAAREARLGMYGADYILPSTHRRQNHY